MHHHHQHFDLNSPPIPALRKIGVAVDLSNQSTTSVTWTIQHYIRPGDTVILLHVSTNPDSDDTATSTANNHRIADTENLVKDFNALTDSKAVNLAKPLRQAQIPYTIHIVKDHEIKERLCVEVERLGLSALIVGRRGSVSDYCLRHCGCSVVVVGNSDETDGEDVISTANSVVGNFTASSVAENSIANSVVEPKGSYVEEIDEMLRQYNEGQLSRDEFNELFDRVFDQVLEEEIMDNTDIDILMSLIEKERQQQSHASTRRRRKRRRHT